jgi:hypothetical protein
MVGIGRNLYADKNGDTVAATVSPFCAVITLFSLQFALLFKPCAQRVERGGKKAVEGFA